MTALMNLLKNLQNDVYVTDATVQFLKRIIDDQLFNGKADPDSLLRNLCENELNVYSLECIKILMNAGAENIDVINGPLISLCKRPNKYTIDCLKYMLSTPTSKRIYPEYSCDLEHNNALMVLAGGEINEHVLECFELLHGRFNIDQFAINCDGYDLLMLLCSNRINQYTVNCIQIFLGSYKYIFGHESSQYYSNSFILLANNISEHTLDAAYVIVDEMRKCSHHQFNYRSSIIEKTVKTVFFTDSNSFKDPHIREKIELLDNIVKRFCGKTLLQMVCEKFEFTNNCYDILMMIIVNSDVTVTDRLTGKTAYRYFLDNPTSDGILSVHDMNLLQGVAKLNNTKPAKKYF